MTVRVAAMPAIAPAIPIPTDAIGPLIGPVPDVIDRARKGDRAAFAELYDLYVPLAAIAYFRENDRPDREEAARERLRDWIARS